MFRVVFLGHQGWLLSAGATHVLVDPLLTERFGHGGSLGVVYPPRRIDPNTFPPIDAVILTHEHDDHFDIPSLNRIDRATPIYLSARSSIAAREILAHMGFCVHPLHADHTHPIGDLRYRTFAADHRGTGQGDEWDVFPFVAYDAAGHGSMMSSVDVAPTEAMLGALRQIVPRPGIWAHANNVTSTRYQLAEDPAPALPDDGDALARVVARRYARVEQHWGPPVATLLCGGGWSFGGERAWLDRHAFPLSSERIRAALVDADPSRPVWVAAPGQSVVTHHGHLHATPPRQPFIEALPRVRWPDRAHAGDGARLTDYAPACGRRSLPEAEREALRAELTDLARHLYGSAVFGQLCSLPTAPAGGRQPALGLRLRTDEEPMHLRYDPAGCRFVPYEGGDPMAELMSGLECWATDLLALLRGHLGPTALCYAGRLRVWNADARRLHLSVHELWTFAHPLRRPGAAAVLYRRLLDAEPPEVPRLPGPSRPPERR